jgi:signal transduction histidine kinase
MAQQARHSAENASRDKDDGLAVIAHELRQPLNTALAALGVVKLNPARAQRALESLGRQIGYMTKLVEDLLHASQVMRGTITLKRERADLTRLVQEAAEFIEPGVHERNQRLAISRFDTPLPVRVDTRRMRQVLTNILSNASKYTPVGGTIVVTVERSGDTAGCVRVRDTGDGISPEALGKVFDLFVRGTTGGNGLGIGLAVAKRLVELQEGTIVACSEGAGCGSEFIVTLPLAPPTA